MTTRWILTLLAWCFITTTALGQKIVEPMTPRRLVNDFTNLLTPSQRNALERKLTDFNNTSSTQIVVVTLADLDGLDINDYATRLGEAWGVGQEGKDNGIVLLIKPKSGREKGQVTIAVGYGLEGVVPDATASRVIREELLPAFRQNDYYGGINRATDVLIDLAKGEYTADDYEKQSGSRGGLLIALFIVFVFLLPLFLRRRGGNNDSYTPGHTSGGGFFFFPMGFGGSGGFGSFSSGSGTFGGFGGGDFGGGGASGDW